MNRLPILILAAASLAGCSVQDVRGAAETVRIRAEGIGAQAEAERSDRLLAEGGGGTAYRDVAPEESLQQPGEGEAGDAATGQANAAGSTTPATPPPQQPVYVIVPAS